MSKGKLGTLIESIQLIQVELEVEYKAYAALAKISKSVHMNEVRLINLEKSFDEARELHQKIIAAPSEETKIKYMETLTFHQLKELYFKYSAELKDQLSTNDSHNQTQSALNNSTTLNKNPTVELKLPPIKIPTFDGSLQHWSEFKGLFESIVNKNVSISDAQKLQYLKGNLTGEAARILRNTDSNFESAWALLIKRYQNLRLLKDNQFKLLFEQPSIANESAEEIKLLVDTTNEAKQSLGNLGVSVETWEDVLIYITVNKLPLTTRGLWESHIASYADYPTYSVLEEFLLMRARTLDVMGQAISSQQQTKFKKHSPGTVRAHNSVIQKCSMCQGTHSIRNCFKFKALNPKKRLDIVNKKRLCVNCLSSAHFTQNCTSTFTCSTCHKRHHSLLHSNEAYNAIHSQEPASTVVISPPTQPNFSLVQNPQSVHQDNLTSSTRTTQALNTYVAETSQPQTTALLATALIKVFTTAGQPLVLRALLDPGSEASFISEAAAQQLRDWSN